LDEKKSKHASLAQQKRFGLAIEVAEGGKRHNKAKDLPEKSKY
jgi:hypothetical protein